ncbi:bifunctional aspartate kinase/homoserine dehydrogenase I [Candidatus Pantoea edessiphila]|uniref:Bifunctional aspartokinase/homoserine dehydrogenase n=1 Tax=Candidatus Pantoea edessiphila TaxID=2044610 RepID=A0A2P5T1Z9_9GAMM|nr:bifunctional aspartate kinase/homoserine dehydrogenase I [Candidatus Pantoea edessiphila]PPI88624.1 bifunctional aspartate kinase/homoserine dehydrogenase I [Candidatus Pantoea edessiphila]
MRVLKFGGTSMGNAKLLIRVAEILEDSAQKGQVIAVLSSPTKITTYLLEIIKTRLSNQDNLLSIKDAEYIFSSLLLDLVDIQPKLNFGYLKSFIGLELNKIKKMLYGVKLLKQCPDNIQASITCIGGKISVVILGEILKVRNNHTSIINPVEKILAFGSYLNSTIDIIESSNRIKLNKIPEKNIILVAGAIAGNERGETVLLGNKGSDYSAAFLAACFKADRCEIWTDADGLYICDLNQVPNANILRSISYNEIIELIYLGANILNIKTINVLTRFQIPCLIKNITNPISEGTVISNKIDRDKSLIKGIVDLNNVVMLNISGSKLKNVAGMLSHIINSLSKSGIFIFSFMVHYQETNISFCVLESDLKFIQQTLKKELKFELQNKLLNPIITTKNLTMISVIGNGICSVKGLCNKVLSPLTRANIDIISVLLNSSGNSISIILKKNKVTNLIKLIYRSLFINNKIIELFIIGIGGVGNALLKQIAQQQKYLKQEKNIKICVCGIANSQQILINLEGIDLNNWRLDFSKTNKIFDTNHLISLINQNHMLNPVIVDCTASEEIANKYINFLSNGFHIVTSNKKANTSSWDYYKKIRNITNNSNCKFLYETNVGAGLPVIENLKNLLNSGDELIKFSGILSGSLSFIFGKLDEGFSISEATSMARKMGYTEPNPIEDLSGMDVARKLLIIARELGYKLELEDINIEPLLPNDIDHINDIDNFMKYLSSFNELFKNRVSKAHTCNKVLRFVGTIEKGGICKVKIDEVGENNPLYKIKNGENALAFYSRYYQPIPLVLRGYGAGNDVTAAGVFADLLRTL